MKIITTNKKAFFDYVIDQKIEAGLVLSGNEVKSIRAGLINLTGSYAVIMSSELYLLNCYIGPYSHAYLKASDDQVTRRSRKLLVHRKEIAQLAGAISRKGSTVVPLKVYLNDKGRIKVELGLAHHKDAPTRKEELRERDIKRETRRELKVNN